MGRIFLRCIFVPIFSAIKLEVSDAAGIFADKNTFPGVDIIRFCRSISEILEHQTIRLEVYLPGLLRKSI